MPIYKNLPAIPAELPRESETKRGVFTDSKKSFLSSTVAQSQLTLNADFLSRLPEPFPFVLIAATLGLGKPDTSCRRLKKAENISYHDFDSPASCLSLF